MLRRYVSLNTTMWSVLWSAKIFCRDLEREGSLPILGRRRPKGPMEHECAVELVEDCGRYDAISALCLRFRTPLAAENLFLRKQVAFYRERKIKPRRANNPTRLTLALLSRWFDCGQPLPLTHSDYLALVP